MSKDNEENTVVSLDAFRKAQDAGTPVDAKQELPQPDDTVPPHIFFQTLLQEPQIAPDMLPDVFRMLLPKLNYHFSAEGQKSPKVKEQGGLSTATLTISPYSFNLQIFKDATDSFREEMENQSPRAFQATLRKAWAEAAQRPPEEKEGIIYQGFVNRLIASTGAYKQTARMLEEANIPRLSFGPAMMLNGKSGDPQFLCVEPCMKLSAPISRHGDIRTILQNYLDRVDRETHPNGKPDLRPV